MTTEAIQTIKEITETTLKKWGACEEGFDRFDELFPKGADLQTASRGLIEDGHPSWNDWLWIKCKADNDYVDQTSVTAGYSGTATAGDRGTAAAGYGGTATAGYGGVIVIEYHNGEDYVKKCAEVDGGKIKANTPYQIVDGEFREVV